MMCSKFNQCLKKACRIAIHDNKKIFGTAIPFHLKYARGGNLWKIKADLKRLKTEIEKYVNNISSAHLQTLTFADGETALSDIIWVRQ